MNKRKKWSKTPKVPLPTCCCRRQDEQTNGVRCTSSSVSDSLQCNSQHLSRCVGGQCLQLSLTSCKHKSWTFEETITKWKFTSKSAAVLIKRKLKTKEARDNRENLADWQERVKDQAPSFALEKSLSKNRNANFVPRRRFVSHQASSVHCRSCTHVAALHLQYVSLYAVLHGKLRWGWREDELWNRQHHQHKCLNIIQFSLYFFLINIQIKYSNT